MYLKKGVQSFCVSALSAPVAQQESSWKPIACVVMKRKHLPSGILQAPVTLQHSRSPRASQLFSTETGWTGFHPQHLLFAHVWSSQTALPLKKKIEMSDQFAPCLKEWEFQRKKKITFVTLNVLRSLAVLNSLKGYAHIFSSLCLFVLLKEKWQNLAVTVPFGPFVCFCKFWSELHCQNSIASFCGL